MGKYNISTELYGNFAQNYSIMKYFYSAPNIQSIILRWPILLMVIIAIAFLSGALFYIFYREFPVVLATLQAADARAMLLLNFNGGAVADRFFYGYSRLQTWLPLAAVLVGYTLMWHQGSWRDRLFLLLIIVAMIAFTDQLSSGIIKPIVARPRPSHNLTLAPMLHYVNDYHGGRYGFVSGHATNISCLVTFLCFIYRNKFMRAVLAVFTVIICYSRIYLGVHYLGDILCGAAIGILVARVVISLCPAHVLRRYDRMPWGVAVVWLATTLLLLVIP
jgi:undecaprenyl-diphosphatase